MRALAAALLLAPGVALADPPASRVALAAAGLTFTLPAGFEAQRAADPSPDLLGTWVRPGAAGEGPVVLQFATVAGALREGTPTLEDLAAWRGSDPFAFDDRAEASSWQGLTLHTRAGAATVNGRAMVRVATVLPLARASVRLAVFAPASRETEARDAYRAVLASARGEAAWLTPAERLRSRALLGVVLAALLGMLAYGALALAVFRTRDGWRPARAAALFAIAALWAAAAVLVPRGQWRVLAQDVALAVVFAHRGWTLRRKA
ncbi:MAG: hypothetical protein U0324_43540 [Polyangiales bacterium]